MKKLDIEKWDRKMPELPADFFNEMQEKVLTETTRKKKTKVFQLVMAWSSVAAVLIFGLMFFLHQNKEKTPEQTIAQQEKIENIIAEPIVDFEVKEEKQEEKNIFSEPKKVEFANQKVEPKKLSKPQKTEEKLSLEDILNEMSESEIRDLAMNYEQDSYLELY